MRRKRRKQNCRQMMHAAQCRVLAVLRRAGVWGDVLTFIPKAPYFRLGAMLSIPLASRPSSRASPRFLHGPRAKT